MEQTENFKHVHVYAQNIHLSNFAQHLGTQNQLLITSDVVRCEICELVINCGPEFKAHMASEKHFARFTQRSPNLKKKDVKPLAENLVRKSLKTI